MTAVATTTATTTTTVVTRDTEPLPLTKPIYTGEELLDFTKKITSCLTSDIYVDGFVVSADSEVMKKLVSIIRNKTYDRLYVPPVVQEAQETECENEATTVTATVTTSPIIGDNDAPGEGFGNDKTDMIIKELLEFEPSSRSDGTTAKDTDGIARTDEQEDLAEPEEEKIERKPVEEKEEKKEDQQQQPVQDEKVFISSFLFIFSLIL
jgi:hypothetical protein